MSVVFTVGYEGTDIDRFVRTLKAAGVQQLADVRAVAVSRKPGFSKKKLAARLAEEGIEYLHFVALGDPKPVVMPRELAISTVSGRSMALTF